MDPIESAKPVVVTGALALLMIVFSGRKQRTALWVSAMLICVAVLSRIWVQTVSYYVPEPYLDEVFHVPQARKYCEGRFREWDGKITTPPGLYILSLIIPKSRLGRDLEMVFSCDTQSLRGVNAVALTTLAYFALLSRKHIEARLHEAHSPTKIKWPSQYAIHTAFNIALCPVIFFFSGLYYTDIASTAVVLAAFLHSLRRMSMDRSSLFSDALTIFLGILALFMRQTNVFWAVVFLGGLEAIHAVKTLRPQRVDEPYLTSIPEKLKHIFGRYALGDIHDPPLHAAWPNDMLFTAVSLLVAGVCNIDRVLRQIWPYVSVLTAFASFVVWNGGVVLGDKSNHVATIHLAQMLYIWPFFAFFSLPLLLPYAMPPIKAACLVLNCLCRTRQAATPTPTRSRTTEPEPSEPRTSGSQTDRSKSRKARRGGQDTIPKPSRNLEWLTMFINFYYWPFYILLTIGLSVAIVKFNTIIHPFTLADNRHYMFYVFRYSIRRSASIRYALVLPYTISRWLIWGAMSGCGGFESPGEDCSMYYRGQRDAPFLSWPFTYSYAAGQPQTDRAFPGALPEEPEGVMEEKQRRAQKALADDPLAYSTEPASTSTALVFLLATTLSLITAPLVEPRYFIIPWVIWRLLVPAWRLHYYMPITGDSLFAQRQTDSILGRVVKTFRRHDLRLVLETVWFAAINVATMYIFLFKPYQWRAEDGTTLDEGRLQRFMW